MSTPAQERPWARLYGKQRWRNRARLQLRLHPLCAECLKYGVITAARVADHIEAHHGDEQKFWLGELQSLCSAHDSAKQQIERGRRGKKLSKQIGADGFPTDPLHPFNQLK
jgi:5-methylcytosine-specific restriction enzyme A